MAEASTQGAAGAAAIEADQLGSLLQKEFKPKTDQARAAVEMAVRTLAEQALRETAVVSDDVIGTIKAIIAEIDHTLTEQINLILHHEKFQQLEGAWRSGLQYLVSNTESDEMLKIRVLNISKKDLGRTLKKYKGVAWDQSPLFKRLYEEEYGQLGGEPYGCLVGDYFDHTPPDVERLLGQIAQIAAASHAPFIAGAAPSLMGMGSHQQQLANPRDLAKIFSAPDYAAWRSLRDSEDAKYIGLAMPRFLARLPYGVRTSPVEEFDFEEQTGAGDHSKYTWANSAYAMAVNVNRSFKDYGWCTRIRGVESGGAVDGLPVHTFPSDDGGVDMGNARPRSPSATGARRSWPTAGSCRSSIGRTPMSRRSSGAIPAENRGVHRCGCYRKRASVRAAAVSLRQLPLRALSEVHGARQDRLVQGTLGHGALSLRLDQGICARKSGGCRRHAESAEAARGR